MKHKLIDLLHQCTNQWYNQYMNFVQFDPDIFQQHNHYTMFDLLNFDKYQRYTLYKLLVLSYFGKFLQDMEHKLICLLMIVMFQLRMVYMMFLLVDLDKTQWNS